VEVADVLCVCTETVWRAIRKGRLRSVRIGWRHLRVAVEDVRAYVEANRR
jgi:excisionase family DNA binding protein